MELTDKDVNLKDLEGKINLSQKKMLTLADQYGRDSLYTIQESQALDTLIMEYMRRKRKIS
ncbi:aspartyl-phosphate phosphatase Spo0E family protein [Thalassobacillus devorans]|uniref:aspartyl-phosphate phosphatase Spo0E family protein n=1 Tax=Thalassobacillus devorans TaxID=279813 RepID=UPI00048AFC94|nr:aspartyl-phosphate phosphatase Spo0E family protein [Thalassobacillus devorans]